MSTKVALVIGAGPRIGRSTALAFSSRGYRVAIAARSFEDGKFNDEGHLQLRLDLSDPAAVQDAFVKVKKAFDTAPSVVVYNGILKPLPQVMYRPLGYSVLSHVQASMFLLRYLL